MDSLRAALPTIPSRNSRASAWASALGWLWAAAPGSGPLLLALGRCSWLWGAAPGSRALLLALGSSIERFATEVAPPERVGRYAHRMTTSAKLLSACCASLFPAMCALVMACSGGSGGDGGGSGGGGGGTTSLCSNTCQFANDNECDDGGEDSTFDGCQLGTDCNDCGTRIVPNGGGSADGGGGDGCPGGCPIGQSCIIDECVDNGGGGSDNGEYGDACACEGTGVPNTYVQCSGTSDGCTGFGGSGALSCLAGENGAGTCSYSCSASEEFTQGSCPSGFSCANSGLESTAGGTWYLCY